MTGPGDAPVLEARNVGRQTAGRDHWLLRDVCISIRGGDQIAVRGPSGAGKTLLLRYLALLDKVDAGEVLWRGQPIRSHEVPAFRSHFIYVHQRPAFLDGTVEDNLRKPFTFTRHHHRRFDRTVALRVLEQLGRAPSFLTQSTRQLSGGEQQLLSLVRALQLQPTVLMLDEPTASLDRSTASQVEQLVQDWRLERPAERALLWVSHDAEQGGRMGSKTITINKGQLTETPNGVH